MKLGLFNASAYARVIRALERARDNGDAMTIEIKRARKPRSLSQNRLLWAVYEYIQQWVYLESGEVLSVDDIHWTMRTAILGMRDTPLGQMPRSTTDMNSEEFSQYLDHVKRLAADNYGVDWTLWEHNNRTR